MHGRSVSWSSSVTRDARGWLVQGMLRTSTIFARVFRAGSNEQTPKATDFSNSETFAQRFAILDFTNLPESPSSKFAGKYLA